MGAGKTLPFLYTNMLETLQKTADLYPVEILDMIDNSGFFKMYESFRKMYNNSSFTNREIYEKVEDLYVYYFLRRKYKSFDSFKTQYARHTKAKKHKQQTLRKVRL